MTTTNNSPTTDAIPVNVDNFARAETSFKIQRFLHLAGGLNKWKHNAQPTLIQKQNVIRMNRDTLYSFAVVDVREGCTVTLPEFGKRYLFVMVLNEDHHVTRVIGEVGKHEIAREECGTPYVVLIGRTLADPTMEEDMKEANALQNQLELTTPSNVPVPYRAPNFDKESYQKTYDNLLELSRGVTGTDRMFGKRDEVSEVRHLLGTAAGWGGLPTSEAYYIIKNEPRPLQDYELTVPKEVPVNGFWSISVYNKDGFFEENSYNSYSLNNLTAKPNEDGSITVRFGTDKGDKDNFLFIMEGWNYTVRLYRPQACVLDGSWSFPEPKAVEEKKRKADEM